MPTPQPRLLTLSRCTLAYRDTGDPPHDAGTPLVLLHGSHGDWRHWSANLPALSRTHRVLVPDMPCFGASSSLPGEPEPGDLAQALSEWVAQLDLTGVTLVGFSFGCLVATALAQAAPARVARLMLVHPPGLGITGERGAHIAATASAIARSEGRRAGIRETLTSLMLADASKIDEAMIDDALSMAQASRLRTTALSRNAKLPPVLANLPQPLTVVFGDRDPYHAHDLDGRRSRLLQAREDANFVLVRGAAHWLQRDQPQAFNKLLLDFAR